MNSVNMANTRFPTARKLFWGLLGIVTLFMVRAQPELRYQIEEEEPTGTYLGNVKTDANLGTWYTAEVLSQIYFRFLRPTDYFMVDEFTGFLSTAQVLDRDVLCAGLSECKMRADVVVQPVQHFKIIKVTIEILDINDNPPGFTETRVLHEILESAVPGLSITLPSAEDLDSPAFGVQRFELLSGEDTFELFQGESADGEQDIQLKLIKRLDREQRSSFQLQVLVYDGGIPPKTGTLEVNVVVLDTNDNNPVFDQAEYEVRIKENTPAHTSILHVHASDRDEGLNGEVRYSFSSRTQHNHGSQFAVNNVSGEISVVGVVDFEQAEVYHLAVMAWDRGSDSIPGSTKVIIRVEDVNDHAPDISVSTLSGTDIAAIDEGVEAGTFVAHITVIDLDTEAAGDFNCSINDPFFDLKKIADMGEGEYQVHTAVVLDRERQEHYSLTIRCNDFGTPPQTAFHHIELNVLDINDHSPTFSQTVYRSNIIENNYVGRKVVQVTATDLDLGENATVVYSLVGQDSKNFSIDSRSGLVRAMKSLNREDHETTEFHVLATDEGHPPRNSSALIVVTIQDVNDERPRFNSTGFSFSLREHSPIGSKVGDVIAEDKDNAPFNELTYSILPGHASSLGMFNISRITGRLTVTRDLDRESQSSYYLVVCAADRGVPPLSSTVSVSIYLSDINDHAPVFEYPKPHNNTIRLSNKVPEGYIVAKVRAYDLDIASNARITYEIIHGDPDHVFDLDSTLGSIKVVSDLSQIQHQVFRLTIEARDHADESDGIPLRTERQLNIIVNDTVPLAPHGHSGNKGLSENNLLIVIILASVSGVVTIILVVAIIIIRRQSVHKPTARYNCRLEADRMVGEKQLGNGKISAKPGPRDASFDGCHEVSGRSWPASFESHNLQHPQACSSVLTRHVTSPSAVHTAHCPHGFLPGHVPPRDVEVHQYLELLKHDGDSHSVNSMADSTADSGRGHSEEGEGPRPNNPPPPSSEIPVNLYPQHRSLELRNTPQSNHSNSLTTQVVPNVTGCSSTSYSSSGPQILQTFSSQTPHKTDDATFTTVGNSQYENGDLDDGFMNTCTPTKILSIDPESCYSNSKISYEKMRKEYQGSIYSFQSNGEDSVQKDVTEVTASDCGIMYSCADMTDSIVPKSVTMTTDDDVASSTSGSYLVDPQDLCQEIDDLFFKDMGL